MSYLNYIMPDNKLALALVVIMLLLFINWWLRYKKQTEQTLEAQGIINSCQSVTSLQLYYHEALKKKLSQKDVTEMSAKDIASANEIFAAYCEEKGIDPGNTLAQHLKDIFFAGLLGRRIYPAELVSQVQQEVLHHESTLRNISSLFIIMGLLGTLIGLTDSLKELLPSLSDITLPQQAGGSVISGLTRLLSHLKGAFAPSIDGVFLTIITSWFFSRYEFKYSLPFTSALERWTYSVLIPHLYPGESERLQHILITSERQLKDNFEHARKVADFAQGIEKESEDLHETLKGATKSLKLLAKSSDSLNQFVIEFRESVNSLTSFQNEIHQLYATMVNQSHTFYDNINASMTNLERFTKLVESTFHEQNHQLTESYRALRAYEEAYLTSRAAIDQGIVNVLDASQQVFRDTSEKNHQLIETIGRPITEKLDLANVTLINGLASLRAQLEQFDEPLSTIGHSMVGNMTAIDNRTAVLNQDVNRALAEHAQYVQQQVDRLIAVHQQLAEQHLTLHQAAQQQSLQHQPTTEAAAATYPADPISATPTGSHSSFWERFRK